MLVYAYRTLSFILLLLIPIWVHAQTQAVLAIQKQYLTRSKLLKHYPIYHIRMSSNRAYPGQDITYTAVKLCEVLKSYPIQSNDMLEFEAADRFSVLIPASKIMSCGKNAAVAFLAIEPLKKWPILFNHTGTTAGPFDVIWTHPEKSYISNEYWAWSVVKITVRKKIDSSIVIDPPKTYDTGVKKGYGFYVSHCAGCHSINHIGKGTIGPDLNDPKNPVEYYPDDKVLKQFIRDPQSVRTVKNARMSGSGKDFLKDADLAYLLQYFHYMVKHKDDKYLF